MKQEIGIATITTNQAGTTVVRASFKPTMQLDACDELIKQLQDCLPAGDVKSKAETVFAAWFSKLNEVELADRSEYKIVIDPLDTVTGGGELTQSFMFFMEPIK